MGAPLDACVCGADPERASVWTAEVGLPSVAWVSPQQGVPLARPPLPSSSVPPPGARRVTGSGRQPSAGPRALRGRPSQETGAGCGRESRRGECSGRAFASAERRDRAGGWRRGGNKEPMPTAVKAAATVRWRTMLIVEVADRRRREPRCQWKGLDPRSTCGAVSTTMPNLPRHLPASFHVHSIWLDRSLSLTKTWGPYLTLRSYGLLPKSTENFTWGGPAFVGVIRRNPRHTSIRQNGSPLTHFLPLPLTFTHPLTNVFIPTSFLSFSLWGWGSGSTGFWRVNVETLRPKTI